MFRHDKKAFGILEILLSMGIIAVAAYFVYGNFLKSPSAMDATTKKSLREVDIDTSSQKSMLGSTKNRIGDINQQLKAREESAYDVPK